MEAQWPRERMPGSHQPPISSRRPSSPTSSAVAAWMWPARSPRRGGRASTFVRTTDGPSPGDGVGVGDMCASLANTCTRRKLLYVIFCYNSVARLDAPGGEDSTPISPFALGARELSGDRVGSAPGDREHHVARLLSGLDVAVGLDDVVERVRPVDYRSECRISERGPDGCDVPASVQWQRESDPAPAPEPSRHRQAQVREAWTELGGHVVPAISEEALTSPERRLADSVEHEVEVGSGGGVVLRRVVDDPGRTKTSHEVEVLGGGYRRDDGAAGDEKLHGCRADRARRPVDQYLLAGPDVCTLDVGKGVVGTLGARRCFRLRNSVRDGADGGRHGHGEVLAVPAQATVVEAEDVVAGLDPTDRGPDHFYLAGERRSEYGTAGMPQPIHEPDRRSGGRAADAAVGAVDGRGDDPYQQLVLARRRRLHRLDRHDIGTAVRPTHGSSHGRTVARASATRGVGFRPRCPCAAYSSGVCGAGGSVMATTAPQGVPRLGATGREACARRPPARALGDRATSWSGQLAGGQPLLGLVHGPPVSRFPVHQVSVAARAYRPRGGGMAGARQLDQGPTPPTLSGVMRST